MTDAPRSDAPPTVVVVDGVRYNRFVSSDLSVVS